MEIICLKRLLIVSILICCSNVFAQNAERDVPYTKELLTFINCYFNHELVSQTKAESYYNNAVNKCPETFTDYQKETHLARCDYYMGMNILESYDLTNLEHALDDPNVNYVDPTEEIKRIKAQANKYFDKAINHADKAILANPFNGSDAYTIYSQIVCGNCTSRPASYVVANGLKISQFARKALRINPKDGTAAYSAYSQDVYAPGNLGNPDRGRKAMLSNLSDTNLICEKFDKFNYTAAVAYTYYRQNNFNEALAWYKKALAIYPKNFACNNQIKKCQEQLGN